MSIYVACGGSSVVNGIYDETSSVWQKRDNNNYNIALNNSGEWEIYYLAPFQPVNTATILYKLGGSLAEPLSTTSWVVVNGISPTVKSYNFNFAAIPSLVLNGAGSSDVNGTYTYQNSVHVNYNTGVGEYVSGYLHSSGAYIITAYGGGVWAIQFRPSFGGAPVYSSTISSSTVPIGDFFVDGFDSGTGAAPTASVNNDILCDGGTTGGTTGGTNVGVSTNHFVYTKNNAHYIRYTNSQPYVRNGNN